MQAAPSFLAGGAPSFGEQKLGLQANSSDSMPEFHQLVSIAQERFECCRFASV
jgi:hypothetical protein